MKCPAAAVALLLAASSACATNDQDLHAVPAEQRGSVGQGVPDFAVRDGYRVNLAAEGVDNARFLQFGDDGTLYVSQPRLGQILAMRDEDEDGVYETKTPFVTEQGNAHSMDFHDGWLWFTASEPGFLKKARDTDGDGTADEVVTVIEPGRSDGIPSGGGHPFRGVLVDGDRVLITVSDPGNMTGELDSDRKTVYAFDLDGTDRRVFASGVRNTEKIRHRIGADGEETGEVWGADHASDWFGKPYGDEQGFQPITDLNPPDELNHLREGEFYGHPYLMADRTPRPEFADRDDLVDLAAKTVPAAWSYAAHSANNGFCFATREAGELFADSEMVGDLFQAQHGSWNRSTPSGYAVTRVLFDDLTGEPYGELKVVDTIKGDRDRLARPVDCAVDSRGFILFSCDMTGKIFRVGPEPAE